MFLAHLNKTNDNRPAIVATEPAPQNSATVPAVIVRPQRVPEPDRLPAVLQSVNASTVETIDNLKPLTLETRRGDFVHNSQTMGTKQGFSHVSERWLTAGNVRTIDNAIQYIESQRGKTRDIVLNYSDLRATADNDGFGLIHTKTGERFSLSSSALEQFAERSMIGRTLPRRLQDGDNQDRETLAIVAQNGLRRIGEKSCLIRTRSTDNSIRAFLSEEYAVIDHVWYLETLAKIVPGGLVSHFRTPDGCDSIFFNLLIPDSVRAESDSDYGGMLACGNGETGRSRLRSLPSIFRAICQNGCIWDRVDGVGYILQVHRGEIELDTLAEVIRDNLNRQIPLLSSGIDSMMATRSIVAGNLDSIPVIGATLQALNVPGLTRDHAAAIVSAYAEQRTEPAKTSAFDIIQGITKAAQGFDAFAQETAERAAGSAMLWTPDAWDSVFSMARSIDTKQLKRIFSKSVIA